MESIQTFGAKCPSCKHYLVHYIKISLKYVPIPGHCVCPEKWRQRGHKRYLTDDNCEYWEQRGDQKKEERKKICEVIEDMQNKLTDILNILNEE